MVFICARSPSRDEAMSVGESDFFANFGAKSRHPVWRRYWKVARLLDLALDLRIGPGLLRAKKLARNTPKQRILIAAVEVPGREQDLADVLTAMTRNGRHQVTLAVQKMRPVGKFDNIGLAIAGHDLSQFDWLLVTDDDIRLPDGFLDLLMYFSHTYDLKFVQPAHKLASFSSARSSVRHWGALVRQTLFVENGPITLFHRDTFPSILPFPSLRWAWGIDVLWSQLAIRHDWKMGIIDGLPVKHWRPVGNAYNANAARDEAVAFLKEQGVTLKRSEIFSINERIA
jgi:hypothetical protein